MFGYSDLVVDPRNFVWMRDAGCPVTADVTHALQQPVRAPTLKILQGTVVARCTWPGRRCRHPMLANTFCQCFQFTAAVLPVSMHPRNSNHTPASLASVYPTKRRLDL
jgi:hypothetical protein